MVLKSNKRQYQKEIRLKNKVFFQKLFSPALYYVLSYMAVIVNKIIYQVTLAIHYITYRSQNNHNDTYPVNLFDKGNVVVGKGTYGQLYIQDYKPGGKLIIGNYCSIADDVRFLLGGNHKYKSFSTYPFGMRNGIEIDKALDNEIFSKGDIVIGDDVWIGQGVKIFSGVTVGQGAILGGYSVVTKDVPPYAIVAGNPAQIIKYRFGNQEVIELLKTLDYNKLNLDYLMANYNSIPRELDDNNIDMLKLFFTD